MIRMGENYGRSEMQITRKEMQITRKKLGCEASEDSNDNGQ